MQSVRILRNPTFLGIAALLMAGVVAFVAAVTYINPPGSRTIAFYTHDAAAISAGDTVRIAGVTVGKIKELSIEPERVRVDATVERGAFVGDQSQVEVRMLTVVGGYYVNLVSLGDRQIGKEPIPADRVTMPYSLVRTLTDATTVTDEVNARPLRESLDDIQSGLTGTNVEALSAVMDAGNSITSTIERQRGQISRILNLSDEYIRALSDYREELVTLISKVSILEQTLVLYSKGFAGALEGLSLVIQSLAPIGTFYLDHREKFLGKVRNWQEIVRTWADRSGVVVRGLRHVRNKLERVLDAQNARPELLATDLCIPLPGGPC